MTEVEQSKPRVSDEEAREFARRADDALARGDWMDGWENHAEIISDLAHTVATEPDRTRAAVVKALTSVLSLIDLDTSVMEKVPPLYEDVRLMRDAIENGRDW